jgi:hypothetical protein
MRLSIAARIRKRVQEVLEYSIYHLRSWRASLNRKPLPELSPVQAGIVEALATRGYAAVSIDEIFTDKAEVDRLKADLEAGYAAHRQSPDTLAAEARYREGGSTRKEYLAMSHKNNAPIRASDPLLRFCSAPAVQAPLTAALGGQPRLSAVSYWTTFPATQEQRTGSQNWHRDHEDRRLIKIFIYLNDVGKDGGPTEYIDGTYFGGPQDVIPSKRRFVFGDYLTENELQQHGLLAHRHALTGLKWTVVFANTSGIHRGGFGANERAMVNITFTSQASQFPVRFTLDT